MTWLAGFNRDENRLGVAVQLCTLPWLGWIPDDLGGCPPPALGRLAAALAIDAHSAAALLAAYGGWQGETRRRHRVQVMARRGWRWCAAGERKLLDEFLLTRALELQPPRPSQLDGLLDVDPELEITRLAWLRRGAAAATPEVLKAELDKLEFLRRHGVGQLDQSQLPAGRRRMLAEVGRPLRR